ncbi:hypothetical protein Rsub_12209 [Raphidocelis subcapitata]|uniref:HMG box domain-containing protein n=1 Tax=Raphidocelis subcapitata TaxID=307507 RepID=A0A2V0PIG3_9CHLO|nr:hypothetical protein Rsub_12209 [Raphidocelis subcapitata]|eukprot:GBF99584.1 hypothetical protein Rsub_12209 [Raphidocelis subcapitata]
MAKAEAKKATPKKAAAKPKVEKKEKKAKKEKDPNAPKRGLGSYMFFAQAKRGEVKAKNPTYGLGEIGKELGAMWKALGDKEKSKAFHMAPSSLPISPRP